MRSSSRTSRPWRPFRKPTRSTLALSLAIFATASSGCSLLSGDPIEFRAHVDCPVLGKKLLLAQEGKDWMLAHEADMPPSVLEFTNAVGRHNEKVDEICAPKP